MLRAILYSKFCGHKISYTLMLLLNYSKTECIGVAWWMCTVDQHCKRSSPTNIACLRTCVCAFVGLPCDSCKASLICCVYEMIQQIPYENRTNELTKVTSNPPASLGSFLIPIPQRITNRKACLFVTLVSQSN